MAYDFPASPAENQEFTPAGGVTYVYKAPRWTVKPTSAAAATVISDTPPASPTHGQLFWESDTGNTYIYYVDPGGAPGQWVQINVGPAGSKASTTQDFSATGTWTKPAGCTHIEVEGVGGGGGGGGGTTTAGQTIGGGGGGSGGYGRTVLLNVTAVTSGAVTIGALGAGGAAGSAGSAGSATSMVVGGTTYTWAGGAGGLGAAGSTVSVMNGGAAGVCTNLIGGGWNGEHGISPSVAGGSIGGAGGSTPLGTGGQSIRIAGGGSPGVAASASGYGGGGGGCAINNTADSRAGGAGRPGFIRVREFYGLS